MLEQLESVYIKPAKFIRLRFRYILPNRQIKVLVYTLETSRIESRILSVADFLNSVFENLLSPILFLQSNSIVWDTISIIYSLKPDNKSDLWKLPLPDIRGLVNNTESFEILRSLDISQRFSGNPMRNIMKVYGISTLTDEEETELTKRCSTMFNTTHIIRTCGIRYDLIYLTSNRQKILLLEKNLLWHSQI